MIDANELLNTNRGWTPSGSDWIANGGRFQFMYDYTGEFDGGCTGPSCIHSAGGGVRRNQLESQELGGFWLTKGKVLVIREGRPMFLAKNGYTNNHALGGLRAERI